jgi:RNA polymerase sigma factor (TIGR02999 family)
MAQEKPGQTLQATALVHEVWLRLGGKEELLRNSSHFFAVAATAMRRILVDIARKKARVRHGGGQKPISIEEIDVAGFETPSETILAVDEALKKLELEDPESAKVAELRYFIGMTIPEVAKAMGISEKTVKRRWEFARVFLFKELSGE